MGLLKKYYSQLIFLIIGITAGFFISRLPLEFEEKTNWVSLASFFLTIGLALYLEFLVRPSLTNNRNEKDLLIEQLKDIKTTVVGIHDYYQSKRNETPLTADSKTEILQKFRAVSNQIDILKQTDSYCTITKNNAVSSKIFKIYIVYKKALTGYKFDESGFFYDRLHWGKIDQKFTALLKDIQHAVIDINKA